MYETSSGSIREKYDIEKNMFNHHLNLINAKPVLKIAEPVPHVDQGTDKISCPPDIVHSEAYSMVRSTYKTLSTLEKGRVDTRSPKTFGLIAKLSKNKKPNNYTSVEHARNLASLCQRINRIQKPSTADRKKNPLDPIGHPSLFFRKSQPSYDSEAGKKWLISLPPSKSKKPAKTAKAKTRKENPLFKELKGKVLTHKTSSKASKGEIKTLQPQSLASIIEKVTDDPLELYKQESLPMTAGNEYWKVKKELIESIVSKRIYKDDDLNALYRRVAGKHKDLDKAKLDVIWQGILDDLNE